MEGLARKTRRAGCLIIKTGNEIILIAGLGNPGEKYAQTRHNMGFKAIDALTIALDAKMPKEKFDGLIFEARQKDKKILLIKPQTFMNDSGRCLSQVLNFYKVDKSNLLVIYDDIDLPEGKVRIRQKGGPGTHNGMRSIVSCLASEDFPRIRIGVGAPENKDDLIGWVLGKIPKESQDKVDEAILIAKEAAIEFAKNGIESAMQKYNKGK